MKEVDWGAAVKKKKRKKEHSLFVRSGHHSAPTNRVIDSLVQGEDGATLLLVEENSESRVHFHVESCPPPPFQMLAASSNGILNYAG